MNMQSPSLRNLISCFLLLLSFNLGLKKTVAQQRTWCIANPMSNNSALIGNIDYACSQVDCGLIQQGGSCFYPNTVAHHASVAMNLYFQAMGRHRHSCDFGNSGLISQTDPSFGSCKLESGGDVAEQGNNVQRTWCVAKPDTRDNILQQNINYACNHVDCSPTQDGGPCFNPTTLINHASFAMNLYFQTAGRNPSSCDFHGTGLIVIVDPSCGDCSY